MAVLIAKRLGFTGALGSKAEVVDGTYTGKMNGLLLHGNQKAIAVRELADKEGIDLKNSYAYSDSHNDFPLLTAVGNPAAINPDTLLQIRAIRDNWPIHDFRRGRALKAAFGPTLARIAAVLTYLSPRRLRSR
jgi:phosphoserine phosphatase